MFFSLTNRTRVPTQILVMTAIIGVLLSSSAFGQHDPLWGSKMLDLTQFKFGSVAKGADAAIQLKVKNIYKEDIQITNLQTGCGCVSWHDITRSDPPAERLPIVIPSGQQRVLTLRLNTIQYDGERKSKATVTLYDAVHGLDTTVDLPVLAFIRKDVVITPGAINFGTVDLGSGGERKVQITYAGRHDWKLSQPKPANPNLTADLREVSRREISAAYSQVVYELTVTLKQQAPQGMLRDQILMLTDDAQNPQVPVMVEAKIEADITITDLQFGSVAPGQAKTERVVIRGKKPFKIEGLQRETKDSKLEDDAFKVKLDTVNSTFHNLPVTFTAPNAPGPFEEEFSVKVGNRPQPIIFKARGRVLEQTGAAKQ